jgi:hypothetical protein
MFILVRKSDNIIVGCAVNKINTKDSENNGYHVYEIDNNEFHKDMIGKKLQNFNTE